MNHQPRVAIIGGSLVGPATELMFRAAGFTDVTTYEAHHVAHAQSGGVMGLRPESLQILRKLGVPTGKLIALSNADVVSFDVLDKGRIKLRRHDLFPGDVTSWDALHSTLAGMTDVHYGKRLAKLDPEGGIEFRDGSRAAADLVVFADGRSSTGRALLSPDRPMSYMGYMVWRGLTDQPPSTIRPLGFHRYYNDPHGTLFSVTEPIVQTGQTYWEFSHNLDAGTFEMMTGGWDPIHHGFILNVKPGARRIRDAYAYTHLPPEFVDVVVGTQNVMAIPINDTPTPTRANFQVGRTTAVLIGDALQSVRLQAGAGLNGGLQQADWLIHWLDHYRSVDLETITDKWSEDILDRYLPWVELGRVRAKRAHLGIYRPTRPGWTVPGLSPSGNIWATPEWVPAKEEK